MKTIWKLRLTTDNVFQVPVGAQILSVQEQGGSIRLWALVDPDAVTEARRFSIYGTGCPLPDRPMTHLGTVQVSGFVWHAFELVTA
jgi:hypothetical protein